MFVLSQQAPTAASGTNGYQEVKAETYLKETFWKSVPAEADTQLWEDDAVAAAAPPSQLVSLNHAAVGVQDVEGMIKCAAQLCAFCRKALQDMMRPTTEQ